MRTVILGAAMTMASCVDTPAPPAVGLANPASASCAEKGGTIAIRDEADGQVGYCSLPDGRVIEEWALFRAESPGG
jgi:putative hemolysin